MPFGLGQDSKQEQTHLPFGINHAPSNSAESTPAKHIEFENRALPFGLEHSPDNEDSQSDTVEADLQKEILPFSIEGPPEPITIPVEILLTSFSSNPESLTASFIAM